MTFFFISGVCRQAMQHLNYKRNAIGVDDVYIDKELCEQAEKYAKQLAQSKYYRHDNPENLNGCGETLHATTNKESLSIKHFNDAIDSWWSERSRLGDSFFGSDSRQGNNYTQCAWKGVKKFGIGAAQSHKDWVFVVARFSPAGNVKGRFRENVPGWRADMESDSDSSGLISNRKMGSALPTSSSVRDAMNGHLHTDDENEFNEETEIRLPEPSKVHDPNWHSIQMNPSAVKMGSKPTKTKNKTKKEIFASLTEKDYWNMPKNQEGDGYSINYHSTGSGYVGSFVGQSRIIDSDEEAEINARNMNSYKHQQRNGPTLTQQLANQNTQSPFRKSPKKKAAKKADKHSSGRSSGIQIFNPSKPVPKTQLPQTSEKVVQIAKSLSDSGTYEFKKTLTMDAKVNSSWKQEALNGDFKYAGMSKFNEPYFSRSFAGKDVFMSLWGAEGKRKWRIGPDVNTKVCWLYTKKRSAHHGIPLNGWYQSAGGGWEQIEDIKITMRN